MPHTNGQPTIVAEDNWEFERYLLGEVPLNPADEPEDEEQDEERPTHPECCCCVLCAPHLAYLMGH